MKKVIVLLLMISTIIFQSVRAQTKPAYDFTLQDEQGKIVKLSDFKGKVIVMDFWFTGCINCMNFYHISLSDAEQHFAHNPSVVFVSICIDKDKTVWLKSLERGRYVSKESVNLYTEGLGDQHPVIKQYQVITYPQPIIIGKKGAVRSRSDHLTEPGVLIKCIDDALK